MTAIWMAQCVCIGVLVAAAAWAFESIARNAGRSLRFVWAGALLLTIALTALLPWRTEAARVHSVRAVDTFAAASTAAQNVSVIDAAVAVVSDAISSAVTAIASPSRLIIGALSHTPASSTTLLSALWLVATAFVALIMLWVYARFRTSRRQWPQALLHSTQVRVSPTTGPMVVGLAHAEIIVPQWLLARDGNEQQLVLEHEREHLKARDPLLLAVACCALIALPWNPVVWFMFARLRLAIELDCDRRLLRRGISVRSYGALLIDLTGHRSGLRLAMPAFACSTSHLERRLLAMTATQPRHIVVRALLLGTAASLALLAACESKLPTSADANKTVALKTVAPAVVDSPTVSTGVTEVPLNPRADSLRALKLEAEMKLRLRESRTVLGKPTQDKVPGWLVVELKRRLEEKQTAEARNREVDLQLAPPALSRDGEVRTVQGVRLQQVQKDTAPITLQIRGRVSGERLPESSKSVLAKDTLLTVTLRGVQGQPASTRRPLIVVDGVVVDSATAEKLAPADIEAVHVVKRGQLNKLNPDLPTSAGQVLITTKLKHRMNN